MSANSANVELLDITKLQKSERNARTHSAAQIKKLILSIKEYGWTQPIVCNAEGKILAGHGRYLAALQMKLTHVPVIRLTTLTEIQQRAYIIADNKLGLLSDWDDKLLFDELQQLQQIGINLQTLGITEVDMTQLMRQFDASAEPINSAETASALEFKLYVTCTDELDQSNLLTELELRGYTCKPIIL